MIEAVCSPARIGGSPPAFLACSVAAERPDRSLAALAGSDLAGRFRHWQGASGRRYLFSVFSIRSADALEHCPRYEEAVVLAVARAEDGSPRAVWIGQTGSLPDLTFGSGPLQDAVAMGANEVHMHLLAKDQPARDAIVRDIAG